MPVARKGGLNDSNLAHDNKLVRVVAFSATVSIIRTMFGPWFCPLGHVAENPKVS